MSRPARRLEKYLSMVLRALHQPAEDGADLSHTLALLRAAGGGLAEQDPERAEPVGPHASSGADDAHAPGTSTPGIAEDLHKAAGLVPYGHLLHSLLQNELGLAYEDPAPGAGCPCYENGLRELAAGLITGDALRPTPDGVEKMVSLAQTMLDQRNPVDIVGLATDTFLLGMALVLRARLSGRQEDWSCAAARLRRAVELIPDDDPLAVSMLSTFSAVLHDRHNLAPDPHDAEAAPFSLARARAIQASLSRIATSSDGTGAGDHDLLLTTGLCGVSRVTPAFLHGDGEALDLAVTEIQNALDGLPQNHAWRSRLLMSLGLARLVRGGLRGDPTDIRRGIAVMRQADVIPAIDAGSRAELSAVGGLALVADGLLCSDGGMLDRGIGALAEAVGGATVSLAQRAHLLSCLGTSHLVCHQVGGSTEQLELGIARLEQARGLLAGGPGDSGDPHAADTLWQLATAYRRRADQDRDDQSTAIESGLLALRARTDDVLLRTGAEHALITARAAAATALTVARWCLEVSRPAAAIEAIELGRGLVMHAATSATPMPELLRCRGHTELADAWEARDEAPDCPVPGTWGDGGPPGQVERLGRLALATLARRSPTELRRRVLAVLRETGDAARLLAPPSIQDVSAALRQVNADALVYLLPGDADEVGRLLALTKEGRTAAVQVDGLRVDGGGPVRTFAACRANPPASEEWRGRLEEVSAWAWRRGIQPLLDHRCGVDPGRPARLVLVPCGELGVVPWHGAQAPFDVVAGGAMADARARLELSYATSARQLVDMAGRESLPLTADPAVWAALTHRGR